MANILLIQPHSDDIVLSCFNKLYYKGKKDKISILTVEVGKKRIEEDKKLEDLFGVRIIPGHEFSDQSYYAYFKDKPRTFDEVSALKYVTESIGEKNCEKVTGVIEQTIASEDWDEIYCPLGVGHPFHLFVNKIAEPYSTHLYLDWPHSYKRRAASYKEERVKSLPLPEEFGDKDMLRSKEEVAKAVYKTQSSLLFFEQNNIKKNFSEKIFLL